MIQLIPEEEALSMILRSQQILAALGLIAAQMTAPGVEAQSDGRIKGNVAGTDGKAIGGVTITISSPALPAFQKVIAASKKGKFRIELADATVPYELRLSTQGFHELLVKVQPVAGSTTTVDAVMVRSDNKRSEPKAAKGKSAAAAYEEGVEALKASDLDTAVAKLRETVELAPDVAEPHAYLAQALLERGEHAAAAAEAERALELEPTHARALYVRYQAYRELGDEERADSALAGIKESDQAGASAKKIFNEGATAYSAGDMATAKASFVVAVKIDPMLPEAFTALAEIYRLEGDFEQSLTMADTVLELRPGDPTGLRQRFNALLSLQRTEEMRATLDELVTADPEWAASQLHRIALAAFNRDLISAAVVLFEKTVETDPDNAKAFYTLGVCYFNSGDTARAGEAMKRFLELAPDDPDAAAARSMLEYVN
jgi:tetratricopeptide (TPR) repeat protein